MSRILENEASAGTPGVIQPAHAQDGLFRLGKRKTENQNEKEDG